MEENDQLEPKVDSLFFNDFLGASHVMHVHACKVIEKNWVKIGFYEQRAGEKRWDQNIHVEMDEYSETHGISIDPFLTQEAKLTSGVDPEKALRFRLIKYGFMFTQSGEEDIYQPPPTLPNYSQVIRFLEEQLSELTEESAEFLSTRRDEKLVRDRRRGRAESKEKYERSQRLGKLRWAPIEALCDKEMVKALGKNLYQGPDGRYAIHIRTAIIEHYRQVSDWRLKLQRKIEDRAEFERRLEYFTQEKTVSRTFSNRLREIDSMEDSIKKIVARGQLFSLNMGSRSDNVSRQQKLEELIENAILEKSIDEHADRDLREFINLKLSLGL